MGRSYRGTDCRDRKRGIYQSTWPSTSLWLSWERICLQCGRPGLNPWVGKMPWRRERLPTPVFWPGEFHGLSPWGCRESYTTEQVSLSLSRPTKQTDLVGDETLITGGMQGVAHWWRASLRDRRLGSIFLHHCDIVLSQSPWVGILTVWLWATG